MSDMAVLGPIERARASARLLDIRALLTGTGLGPMDRIRLSGEGILLREQLGAEPDEPSNATRLLVTGKIPQKNGGLLVVGDPDALTSYAHTYLDQAKFTKAPTGILLSKSQTRLAQYLPTSKEVLPSGAVIYSYADIGGVAVAVGRDLSGIARHLPELKSLMAQEWGPEKFRAVFGVDAPPADVAIYQEQQAAIAQRKVDGEQSKIDQASAAQAEAEQKAEQEKAQALDLARVLAEQDQAKRDDFAKTIGAGKAENPIYQAYLDTLEQLPTFDAGNSGFLGWAGLRAGEFERLGKGQVSTNKAEYLAYVRGWADEHLAKRLQVTKLHLADIDELKPNDGRAPAGGILGMNGEFYKGGTILPTTTLPKGSTTTTTTAGTGLKLIEPGVYAEPPVAGAMPVFGTRREFLVLKDGVMQADEGKKFVMLAIYGKDGPAQVRAHAREYNAGRRWIMPGEKITPTAEDRDPEQKPAAVAPQHEIIEYTTKSTGKVLRGIIRMDLSLADAKEIDPHTWRMNGGYFIREKYLDGDTSAIQAAPAPVVLTPEQETEKQERESRQAEERKQQALASQVNKLRDVANKAIDDGQGGMNQERKTNTARRAGMAASAYAQAAANEAEGLTLNSIADAIEAGAAGVLGNLSSRAQLQQLNRALSQAKYESDKGLSYSEQTAQRGRPAEEKDLQHVTFPVPLVWSKRFKEAALIIAKGAAKGNSRLIAALNKLGNNPERFRLTDPGDIAVTRKGYKVLQSLREGYTLQDTAEALAKVDRLNRMGITNTVELQDACRALLPHLAARKEESAVTKAERAIIGQKVGIDFFPTPAHVAQRMARLARISKGDRVLEPSAGNGNLADAAAAEGGTVDVIEISSQLRDILTAKGYNVVDHDFMGFTPEAPYDAILMNPPFSKRQDAEHIMHAFGMLKGGGTLVAVAGEGVFFGQDKKAEQFRAWLDSHNAEVEKLDGGTFNDTTLLAQTGANARLITIRK